MKKLFVVVAVLISAIALAQAIRPSAGASSTAGGGGGSSFLTPWVDAGSGGRIIAFAPFGVDGDEGVTVDANGDGSAYSTGGFYANWDFNAGAASGSNDGFYTNVQSTSQIALCLDYPTCTAAVRDDGMMVFTNDNRNHNGSHVASAHIYGFEFNSTHEVTRLAAFAADGGEVVTIGGANNIGSISAGGAGNVLTMSGSAAGSPTTIAATGPDTDVGISLTPKGAGKLTTASDVSARTLTLDGGGGNVMALGLPTGGWECFDMGVCDARMWYDGNDLKVSSGIGSHFYSNIPIVDHGALAVRADDSRPRLDIDTRTGGNVTFTPSGTDPSIGFELYPVGNGSTTIINSADGGVRWQWTDSGMQYPDGTLSSTAGATSGLVQWDAQATTTPNVGSAFTSYHSTSVSGFWFHVDTTSGNQLQLVADGGAQASDKTAGFITSDTLPSADYRVRSMIQLCASTLTSSCDRFAVIARASQSGGALTAYYFTISGFTGTTAATVGLYKVVADSFTAIGPTSVTLATYFPGIAPGDYVAMDLEVHGGNIRGYINGRLVASGYDTAIAAAGGGGVAIQPAIGSSTMDVIDIPFFGLLPYAPFNY